MKMKNQKGVYVSPNCETIDLRTEGIICASRNDYEQENW